MKRTTPIDHYIGQRIREARAPLRLTQQDLARELGVTYQQIHKRECGTNRTSAADLWMTAKVLGVTLDYFFEGFEASVTHIREVTSSHKDRLVLDTARVMQKMSPDRQRVLASITRLVRDGDLERGAAG